MEGNTCLDLLDHYFMICIQKIINLKKRIYLRWENIFLSISKGGLKDVR